MQPNQEYLNRIKQTSPPELIHRFKRLHRIRNLRAAATNGGVRFAVPPLSRQRIDSLVLPDLYFAAKVEPDGGSQASPSAFFQNAVAQSTFDTQNASRYFADVEAANGDRDIRQVWEPARLQALLEILHSPAPHPDEALQRKSELLVKEHLFGWLRANPFLMGPHWMSPMECGLRIPVFVYALKKLPNLEDEEIEVIGRGIYEHAWWIFRNLSLYASLGNHTICEATGLIFAGALFGDKGEAPQWLARGIELLESERDHQILDDGGPAEQSLGYHRFVLDLYGLCADLLERNRLHDCGRIIERLEPAETFLAAFTVVGATPAIGDCDDGHAVGPNLHPKRQTPASLPGPVTTFEPSGYTVFRPGADVLLTFDHGPLGMAPLYNHGHADALSITLTVNGFPVFVDPGTYRYNGVPDHRRYFKGTRAHNTVTVNGRDQAVQQTGFIWSAPYRTELLAARKLDGGFFIAAENDGYARLANPVRHKRTLLMLDPQHFLVRDTFRGRGSHAFQLNFHLHPDVVAERSEHGWRLAHGGAVVYLALLLGSDDFEVVRGRKEPLMGWYSPAYGVLQETSVLSLTRKGKPGDVVFLTGISVNAPLSKDQFTEKAQCILNTA